MSSKSGLLLIDDDSCFAQEIAQLIEERYSSKCSLTQLLISSRPEAPAGMLVVQCSSSQAQQTTLTSSEQLIETLLREAAQLAPKVILCSSHFLGRPHAAELVDRLQGRIPFHRMILKTPAGDLRAYAQGVALKCFECLQGSAPMESFLRSIDDALSEPLSQPERLQVSKLATQKMETAVNTPNPHSDLRTCFHGIANAAAIATGYTERSLKLLKNPILDERQRTELKEHLTRILESLDEISELREAFLKSKNLNNIEGTKSKPGL